MYNLFDRNKADQLLARLEKITPDHKAQWGKMSASQMLAHCAVALDTPFGKDRKQGLMGLLFGKMGKKSTLKPEPFRQGLPTDPSFTVKDQRNFEKEKARVEANIKKFVSGGPSAITCKKHPFFGEFSVNDWSFLMHKHLDHHFRQFGA